MNTSLSFFQKIGVLLKLMRWFHLLAAIIPFIGLYCLINVFARSKGLVIDLYLLNFILLCLGVQLLLAIGCVFNDVMDADIDKINKPNTHLIGRQISKKGAINLILFLSIILVLLSVYIICFAFYEWIFIAPFIYVLSISYDMYFKRSPLMGNILMGILTAFIPLTLYFYAYELIHLINNEKLFSLITIYTIWPMLIIVPRELSLDISDWEGDKANNCRTLPIVIGVRKARKVVVLLLFPPFVYLFYIAYNFPYLNVIAIVNCTFLLVYIFLFYRVNTRIEYIKIGRFLWFIMLEGLVFFTYFSL